MLPKHYTNEKTGISYTLLGDYYLPDLVLPKQEDNGPIGKWGSLHKSYLQHHKRVFYNTLVSNLTLHSHLADIDEQARDMFDTLIEQMMKREGVTEELKEKNQIEWICRMGNIQERATEIVCKELIYT